MTNTELHSGLTMQELLQLLPGAQRALFRLYHIGGCSSCGFRPDETVAEVCERNENLDPAEVLPAILEECRREEALLVEPSGVAARLGQAEAPVLLDIRTSEEFEAVALPGSIHFTQPLMQEMLAQWPKDREIVVIDHQGSRALDAVAFFVGHGFSSIKALRGGIDAWSLEVDSSLPRYHLEAA